MKFSKFSKLFLSFLILTAGKCALALESQKTVVSQDDQNQKLWIPQGQSKAVLDRIDASNELIAQLAECIFQVAKSTNTFTTAGIDITDPIIKKRAKDSCRYTLAMMLAMHIIEKHGQIEPSTGKHILEPSVVDCLLKDTLAAQVKLRKIVADALEAVNFSEKISEDPFFAYMFVHWMDNSKHDGYFAPNFDEVLPYYLPKNIEP